MNFKGFKKMGNSSGSHVSSHNKQTSSSRDKWMPDRIVREREVAISSDISSNSYVRNAAGQHSWDTGQAYAFILTQFYSYITSLNLGTNMSY